MARTHDALDDTLRTCIAEQPLFFVASAPDGPDGHVDLSPFGRGETQAEKNGTSIDGLPGPPGAAP